MMQATEDLTAAGAFGLGKMEGVLSGTHVLVTDPDIGLTALVARFLEFAGASVMRVATADSAREVVERQGGSIDAAVINPALPDASGLDLARDLEPVLGSGRIIITTNHPYLEAAAVHSGYGFVTQPVQLGELIAAISRAAEAVVESG